MYDQQRFIEDGHFFPIESYLLATPPYEYINPSFDGGYPDRIRTAQPKTDPSMRQGAI